MTVDDLDQRLLALLQADARRSTASLADELGVPRTTLHERIERLRRRGIIRGFTTLVSRSPSWATSHAIMLVSVVPNRAGQIATALEALPEVKQCFAVAGEYAFALRVEAPLNEDIEAVQDEIMGIEGVDGCRSHVVLSTKFDRSAAA